MNKFVLREPFFLLAFALYPAFCRPREGQHGKLMFFFVLSYVSFISKQIHHCYLQGRNISERLVGGKWLLFPKGTGEGQEEHLSGDRVACTSSHVKQIWAQPSCSPFP